MTVNLLSDFVADLVREKGCALLVRDDARVSSCSPTCNKSATAAAVPISASRWTSSEGLNSSSGGSFPASIPPPPPPLVKNSSARKLYSPQLETARKTLNRKPETPRRNLPPRPKTIEEEPPMTPVTIVGSRWGEFSEEKKQSDRTLPFTPRKQSPQQNSPEYPATELPDIKNIRLPESLRHPPYTVPSPNPTPSSFSKEHKSVLKLV